MQSPEICACIVSLHDLDAAVAARDKISLYEVRIDLIGAEWPRVASALSLPWIACNRMASQGGASELDEGARLEALTRAVELGAGIVDIEMAAPDVREFIAGVKGKARVLVSDHDFEGTAGEEELAEVVERQRSLGADICKVVTTAQSTEDVVTVLRLARRFHSEGIVTFAMGSLGIASRVLAPIEGSLFTYAALVTGSEAAPGQITVDALRAIYDAMGTN
jgi:3-dehydroquinate dehydratase-1